MSDPEKRSLSRRDFLRLTGVAVASAIAVGCQPKGVPSPDIPLSTAAPAITPASQATAASRYQVSVGEATTYDRALIRQQMETMLDSLGGLEDIVSPGARVVIKTNLTSGNNATPPEGFTATESYATHPEVVRAVGELVRDAGAGQIFIVEAIYDDRSYTGWGYADVAKDLNATLIDLNATDPYRSFVEVLVPGSPFIFDKFTFNALLSEADTFISVAKMKCHFNAGITLAMKNLFGLLPVHFYRENSVDGWRSSLHTGDTKSRLPRIILDLNQARPIHLAVVDGIMTGEGGELPRGSFKAVQPGLLVAGKNAVATDAVGTELMSFDPTVEPPDSPFLRGDNYLNLATQLGMGTNNLDLIDVLGAKIEDVRYPFAPARSLG